MTDRRRIKSPVRERVKLSPDAEGAFYRYARGFLEGNLEPLADYLAAGHPMDHAMRRMLVEAIEGHTGDGFYRLSLNQKDSMKKHSALRRRRDLREDVEIVAHFRLLPAEKGHWLSRVKDTAVHFGVGTTRVKDALRKARERQSGTIAK